MQLIKEKLEGMLPFTEISLNLLQTD